MKRLLVWVLCLRPAAKEQVAHRLISLCLQPLQKLRRAAGLHLYPQPGGEQRGKGCVKRLLVWVLCLLLTGCSGKQLSDWSAFIPEEEKRLVIYTHQRTCKGDAPPPYRVQQACPA